MSLRVPRQEYQGRLPRGGNTGEIWRRQLGPFCHLDGICVKVAWETSVKSQMSEDLEYLGEFMFFSPPQGR